MSVNIHVHGISRSIYRLPNTPGINYFFFMRKLGYIGPAVRSFLSIVKMMKTRLSEEVGGLLNAKNTVQTVHITEIIADAHKKGTLIHAVEIAKCLWNK